MVLLFLLLRGVLAQSSCFTNSAPSTKEYSDTQIPNDGSFVYASLFQTATKRLVVQAATDGLDNFHGLWLDSQS